MEAAAWVSSGSAMTVRKALSLTIWMIWLPITGPAASRRGGRTIRQNSERLEKPKATPASIGSPRRARRPPPRPAKNSRHMGRVVERQRRKPGGPVVEPEAERRQAIIDDIGEQQERHAAHAVDEAARGPGEPGPFRHQRRRQDKTDQQCRDRRQHRQNGRVGEPAEKQAALTPDDAEIMNHAA